MPKHIKIGIILLCLIFMFPSLCIASDSIFTWSSSVKSLSESIQTSSTPSSTLNLNVGSAILIEQSSGQVLYEQNMHQQ